MKKTTIKTPGVYINELNAFPNSVVPVPTAVPAFIGYTPQASYEGKSYTHVPVKISSFAEFMAFFCYPNPPAPADPAKQPAKQYTPSYYLLKEKNQTEKGNYVKIEDEFFAIVPDSSTIYYLYNSIRLFYENGGADAYIVSVGTYGAASGKPLTPGEQIINPNVKLPDLLKGLALLKKEQEPTMYICPEATLLSPDDNGTLMQEMLLQCADMQTAISIFDVIGARDPDPITWTQDIENFRNSTGTSGLAYGVAYYPFVGTSLMQSSDLDYTNLFGGDIKQLQAVISPSNDPNPTVETIISHIEKPPKNPLTVSQYHNSLIVASPEYSSIMHHVLREANLLPPSAGIAGVITTTDNEIGPWQAPANASIVGVTSLPINLTEAQQGELNVDAVSGKSINALRSFAGLGILIWGARTLDGNSLDWRYIPVRRTMTFLEQSCKLAIRAYVFEPNNKNTWEAVMAMLTSFLTGIWEQGGLQGASPADAFSVECGLGSTMTSEDLLRGFMNVSIKLAVVRPAEFIVITIQQEMANSS